MMGTDHSITLRVKSLDGVDLKSPEVSMDKLMERRNFFSGKHWESIFFVILLPWGASLFYAGKLR